MILHTVQAGSGTPLLLLHSGGMTAETEYEEQSVYFSERGYQVIRVDLRGHGKSTGSIDHFFTDCVNDLAETLRHLEIESCHVAGVSVGGAVAVLFAQAYPEFVTSVTFSGIFPKRQKNWEVSLQEEKEHFNYLSSNEETSQLLDEMHHENDWRALLRLFNHPEFYPYSKLANVKSMTVPMLCLIGEEQPNEIEAALLFKELQPAIHLAIVPFAGHLVHRDQPDHYAVALETFLTHVNSSSS